MTISKVLFAVATLSGTFGLGTGQAALAVDLTGAVRMDGSSTVFPVTEAVAEEFQAENQKVKITVGVSGTGGGFKKFIAGEIDLNSASRPMKAEEMSAAKKNGIASIELPIAYDGITVVINPKNTFVTTLTVAQLKKLWEPGSKVKTWKDLNAAWPADTIKLYGPGADSGTFEYFTETIVGKAKASRNDYTASEDDNTLVNGVAGDVNALAYFGYGYFSENKNKLKTVPLDAGSGAIEANDTTIESGKYPLSRPLFIVVSAKAAARPEVDAFVKFYLKNAAELASAVGYTPLNKSMYAAALKRYEKRQAGNWNAASH